MERHGEAWRGTKKAGGVLTRGKRSSKVTRMKNSEKYMTNREVAAYLRRSRQRVWQLVQDGTLARREFPHGPEGPFFLFLRSSVERYKHDTDRLRFLPVDNTERIAANV